MNSRAVLLVNLGSPDQPDVPSVRRYLDQFLMDPYVIQLPWLLRRLIVSLFVLPKRPARSAHAYQSIWTPQGSPLVVLSMQLLQQVQQQVSLPVAMAMRYGSPSIESELLKLATQPGVNEILLLPLYPHYAESTVLTTVKEAERVIAARGLATKLLIPKPFYDQRDYIRNLVTSAQPWLAGSFDHVLFSYHGLPELHVTKADPTGSHCLQSADCCQRPSPAHATCYRHQVLRTTELFVQATGLRPEQYSVSFQSRLGRAKWLEPYTEQELKALAARGVKNLLVLCPAFVTDCLETLEEIEIQGAATFKAAGGDALTLVPCLNAHPDWVHTVAQWITAA
ncbi:MAG TPA: ferrochelatase [Candidatus Acidoferrum sp.]|nr:ferrochelatase [Candidatus Acidoferrum sp.]